MTLAILPSVSSVASRRFSELNSVLRLLFFAFAVGLFLLLCGAAQGQIYVTSLVPPGYNNVVGEFNLNGSTINSSLVTGLAEAMSIATSGSDIFVGSEDVIGEYTTSGAIVNASLISSTGLENYTMAISGSSIYVAQEYNRDIVAYNLDGTVANSDLLNTASDPLGVAAAGSNIFILDAGGNIEEWTTAGTFVGNIITGLTNSGHEAFCLTVSGSNLFIGGFNGTTGTVLEYTTSGTLVNASLVTGLTSPTGLAVSGTKLYIADDGTNQVSTYDLTNSTYTSDLFQINDLYAITVATPEPPIWTLWTAAAFWFVMLRYFSLAKANRQRTAA